MTKPATTPSTSDEAMLNHQFETGFTGVAPRPGSASITEVVMPAKSASRLVGKMFVE